MDLDQQTSSSTGSRELDDINDFIEYDSLSSTGTRLSKRKISSSRRSSNSKLYSKLETQLNDFEASIRSHSECYRMLMCDKDRKDFRSEEFGGQTERQKASHFGTFQS